VSRLRARLALHTKEIDHEQKKKQRVILANANRKRAWPRTETHYWLPAASCTR
jgi:hypothetical protein